MQILGRINAVGTAANPVVFKGSEARPGWWRGIEILGDANGSFQHCEVRESGYFNGGGIRMESSGSLSVRDCLFKHNSYAGLHLLEGFSSLETANNRFEENEAGIRLGANVSFEDPSAWFSGNAKAPVVVSGLTHTRDVAWKVSPEAAIYVESTLTVDPGSTLTLREGTVLKFARYNGIDVRGRLSVEGTAARPVHFTDYRDDSVGGDSNNDGAASAPGRGWWSAIRLFDEGSGDFAYCRIAYGGYRHSAGIRKTGTGELLVRNCTLFRTAGSGVYLSEGAERFVSENNTFEENTHGLRVGLNTSFSDTTSLFAGNEASQVLVDGGEHAADSSWELSSGYAIRLWASVKVGPEVTLTIVPGTVLKFDRYKHLEVAGTLHAAGTSTDPITFTDYRDDEAGGDTNNNGDSDAPMPGYWGSVYVHDEGSAELDHCVLRYGGYWQGALLRKEGGGDLSLTNCTLEHSNEAALHITEGAGNFVTAANIFRKNRYGIRLGANTSISDNSSLFADNEDAQVLVDADTHTVDTSYRLPPGHAVVLSRTTTVAEGATLTLEPGLVMKFQRYHSLVIEGLLQAEGTADSPITFTDYRDDSTGGDSNGDGDESHPDAGYWGGLLFTGNGSGNLLHCHIGYAGYWHDANVRKEQTGSLSLRHCRLHHSSGAGLFVTSGYGDLVSENNHYESNEAGVRLGPDTSFRDTTSIFRSNSRAPVLADGGSHELDLEWRLSSQYALVLDGNQTVGAGTRLTLHPGLVLKFERYAGISVQGELVAHGTPGSPIVFTAEPDDSSGGDTNGDGAASEPAAGYWRGLNILDTGSASLLHCRQRYGGYWQGAGIAVRQGARLSMNNCAFTRNAGNGLLLDQARADLSLSRCRFTANDAGVLVDNVPQTILLEACSFSGNAEYGVRNAGSEEVDARGGWWGSASGPYNEERNPEGSGDRVTAGVLFDPWRQSESLGLISAPLLSGRIVEGDTLRFLGGDIPDPAASFSWDFGDGRTSRLRDAGLVTFPLQGDFTVRFHTLLDGVPQPSPDIRDYDVVANDGVRPDLVAEGFTVPDSLAVGEPAMIHYTIRNAGNGDLAERTWIDRLYLSDDVFLDATDHQCGELVQTHSIPAGASLTARIPLTLPPLAEGDRFLLLSLDDDWGILDLHRLNNHAGSEVAVSIPSLSDGVPVEGRHGTGSVVRAYKFTAAPGTGNLLIEFESAFPGLELLLRHGKLPTEGDFDHRFEGGRHAVSSPANGTWYLLVRGDSIPAEGTFDLRLSSRDLILQSATPTSQATESALEMSISGAGFFAPLEVSLLSSNGTAHPAEHVDIHSYSSLTAFFPADSLPPDSYDLQVRRGESTADLPEVIAMVSGGEADFHVNVISPEAMGYHQLATLFVEYENRGTAPMPAPMLLITALQNGQPGALFTLDRENLARGFWTSAIPDGFQTSIRLLASGEESGLLQPG